ncbi:Imm52 family immunity protein [Archangium violaceum]|uniref:Imm52 family immunity protein n=1 Tax=Archangium violaceum TaxID=83451 RepID=UPI003D2B2795
MRESYSATAYWRRRSESREEWAARAETFFRLLAQCHPSFSRWYEEGRSAEESRRPVKGLEAGGEPLEAPGPPLPAWPREGSAWGWAPVVTLVQGDTSTAVARTPSRRRPRAATRSGWLFVCRTLLAPMGWVLSFTAVCASSTRPKSCPRRQSTSGCWRA